MTANSTRRAFLGTAVAATGALSATASAATPAIKILAISASPRAGKTTAAALKLCLEAAAKSAPGIETELIELAGLNIPVFNPLNPDKGDFEKLVPKLADPRVAAILIGTPTYFGNMSSLCKAFLDHCIVLRKNNFALRNKIAGVVAVGGSRSGGQELVIQSVQAALMCQEMIVVGNGRPVGHGGATLQNNGKDDISTDEFGLSTLNALGAHIAEVALRLAR